MKPEVFDVVELLEDMPARNLKLGMQGTILEDYGTAYEVEFADDHGATIEMLALKPDQFVVVWRSVTQSWLPVSDQVAAIVEQLPDDRRKQVFEYARSLWSQNKLEKALQ
ncbi:hypothetical protein LEP3755_05450 [Leptolyngbya sp. NIES-3755]|nr:hypothetical protein LEP3755_05450 [Leptolyngbya sp. NIES-3755]